MKTNPEWPKPKTRAVLAAAFPQRRSRLYPSIQRSIRTLTFDALMGELHYLGSTRPIEHFLRQVVVADDEWIAPLAWGPACYSLQDRDDWIDGHPAQRSERLNLIIQNRRFLLLHERRSAPNLASKVLVAAMKALQGQWTRILRLRTGPSRDLHGP